jgi:hypothetical protein
MQVMVLEQDQFFQAQLASALMGKGFQVICVDNVGAAENFIRLDFIDILVFGERLEGKLSHSVALLAECKNPLVNAVLLTDRTGNDIDELFDLLPSVYAILGRKVTPAVVAQVVLASTVGTVAETVEERLSTRWSMVETTQTRITVEHDDDVPVAFDGVVMSQEDGDDALVTVESLAIAHDSPSGGSLPTLVLDSASLVSGATAGMRDEEDGFRPGLTDLEEFADHAPAAPAQPKGDVRLNAALVQSWLQNSKGSAFNRPLADLARIGAASAPAARAPMAEVGRQMDLV